jgi:transcriptional antiterminator RfaH
MSKAAKLTKESAATEVRPGPAWYVVCAKAGWERIAVEQLTRQGYEVYLPMKLHMTRKAGQDELLARPFFPRYLFVRLDLVAQRWRPILSTIGVASMLMGGDHPMWLADRAIDRLKAQEEGGFIKLGERAVVPERFTAGQKVAVVVGGVVEKLEATFCEPVDENRVAVLLSLLGRDSRVVVNRSQVTEHPASS